MSAILHLMVKVMFHHGVSPKVSKVLCLTIHNWKSHRTGTNYPDNKMTLIATSAENNVRVVPVIARPQNLKSGAILKKTVCCDGRHIVGAYSM